MIIVIHPMHDKLSLNSLPLLTILSRLWYVWCAWRWIDIFKGLRILGLLSRICRHCLARSDHTNFALNIIGRLENTLMLALTECKEAFALLRALLLEVQPLVLFYLRPMLLHLNLVRVLEVLYLFAFLLFDLLRVVSLHTKVFWKLKLCNCSLLTSLCTAHAHVCRASHHWLATESTLILASLIGALLLFCHPDVVHGHCHFLSERLVSYHEAKLRASQVCGCEGFSLFVTQLALYDRFVPHSVWWIHRVADSALV